MVVDLLLFVVDFLDLAVTSSESAQLFDFGSKSVLLVLHLRLDLLNELVKLLQTLALGVVETLLELGHTLDLILNIGVALNTLLLLKLLHKCIDILSPLFQDCLSAFQYDDFTLNLIEHFLHNFEVCVLHSEIGRVLSEVVSLHVFSTLLTTVFLFLFTHHLFEGHLLHLQFLALLFLLSLLLGDTVGLRLVNVEFVVGRRVHLDFLLKLAGFSAEAGHFRCEPLEFGLGGNRFLEQHLDALEAFLFVVELAPDHIIADFAVLSRLVAQVVEHLFGTQVLPGHFLGVHEALSNREELMLVELNHAGQLTFFLVQTCVILLLFAELRGGLEECLEIGLVTLVLEEVDLRQ